MVTSLLRTVQRVRERGDLPRARALLRTLSEQAPGDWQVWQALADVAETDAERLMAIERLASLAAPGGPRVTARLEAVAPQAASERPPTTDHRPPQAGGVPNPYAEGVPGGSRAGILEESAGGSTDHRRPEAFPIRTPKAFPAEAGQASSKSPQAGPPTTDDDQTWRAPTLVTPAPPPGWFGSHWLTYASVAALLLLLLAAALLLRERLPSGAAMQPTITPALATAAPIGAPDTPPVTAALPTLAATTAPGDAAGASPTAVPADAGGAPTAAIATPTAMLGPTAAPALAVGQVVDRGDWSVTVLRPEHLLPLSGSIGEYAPRGRFVLALVAVSNLGPAPAPLPADALALVDARGTRYPPVPAASTAYLSAYQRGLRGDLSMEEPVPPGAGIVSVPVIFDVPPDARGLTLVVDGAQSGWPVAP
jgi:hypothetical protein